MKTSTETKSSKGVSVTNKANNSGNEKKSAKSTGTIVKSRYLQSAEKAALSKSNSSNNETMAPPPRPASPKPRPRVSTPPRLSVTPLSLATSIMTKENSSSTSGKYSLQSTFTDGHNLCPDFDISAIKGVEKTMLENIAGSEWNPENDKTTIMNQTFLLAYLTAKMESNTRKYREEAETKILQAMEEEESLYLEVLEKKRQYEIKEKNRLSSDLLTLQATSLTPVAESAPQFTKVYKSFAAAVDATRHELPVKNFYMDGEQSKVLVLEKAETCLKDCENLLEQCTHGNTEEINKSLECLKSLKATSKDVSQRMCGAFSELLELSSLICQETIHLQQATEEEQLGSAQTQKLFCPKQ